ncbi:hypothetical protein KJD10_05850 (plasmid) [Borreliella valaisiana]|uniref:hypothetical protein n=1 Tax=Borreliella valaisiana TaxID=62088 RepID=UPI0027380E1A|nr:hypothetical protein [Borreliella valaisiana]WLN25915.1 hypothetical protein KJD10_05850 [Borreliella valaisiana]
MFIICVVFALISSFKNYLINKDVKKLDQVLKKQVKRFLDTKDEIKEITGGVVEGTKVL